MNTTRVRPNSTNKYVADIVQDTGNTDYVLNGEIVYNAPIKTVLVSSESDLQLLTGYEPGTIAYTAGFSALWQMSPTGTWVEM